MSTWMLLTVSALYFATGLEKLFEGSLPWFGFWSAYAIANICWLIATKGM